MDVLDKKLFQKFVNNTWNIVADDCFYNDVGKLDTSIVFTRSEMVEIAMDRMTMHLNDNETVEYERIREELPEYGTKEWDELMVELFPTKLYGW